MVMNFVGICSGGGAYWQTHHSTLNPRSNRDHTCHESIMDFKPWNKVDGQPLDFGI